MLAMGFPFAQVWAQLVGAVGVHDVLVGISKSFVFGAIIAGLGCLRGMQTKEGPERRRRLDDARRRRRDPHDHRRRRGLQRPDLRAARMSDAAPVVIEVEDVTIAYGDKVVQKDISLRGPARRGLRHPRRIGMREELAAEDA